MIRKTRNADSEGNRSKRRLGAAAVLASAAAPMPKAPAAPAADAHLSKALKKSCGKKPPASHSQGRVYSCWANNKHYYWDEEYHCYYYLVGSHKYFWDWDHDCYYVVKNHHKYYWDHHYDCYYVVEKHHKYYYWESYGHYNYWEHNKHEKHWDHWDHDCWKKPDWAGVMRSQAVSPSVAVACWGRDR
ncbi:hypothetical protein ACGF3G_08945 [Streptomyces sp. NPDC048179]|uniref:hypothetical protein n=1 Tax=Streptomyces sp. NPDC048179 TaxID=3365506 RepID=UPI0037121CBE